MYTVKEQSSYHPDLNHREWILFEDDILIVGRVESIPGEGVRFSGFSNYVPSELAVLTAKIVIDASLHARRKKH